MAKKGKLFVISAPSGSGKTTLCEKLALGFADKRIARGARHSSSRPERNRRKLVRSISATTRKPREGERHGKDYFFTSREEFLKGIKAKQFLEWAKILDNYYGTPLDFVQKHINRGDDVLLSIDVQGARKIKRLGKFNRAVFIFVMAPNFAELERRLCRRSTEDKKEVMRRLKLARKEMGFVKEYNYVVLNDKISRALARLKEIINFERRK